MSIDYFTFFINHCEQGRLDLISGYTVSKCKEMEEIKWLPFEQKGKNLKDYFACQILGESMNRIIPNGSICLFKKYNGGSRNGKIVLCQHNSINDYDFQ